jgi:hypothetical protein
MIAGDLMSDERIKIVIAKIDNARETIEENNPNPISASHAKTKQEAYYSGIDDGLTMALRIVQGGV